MSKFLAVLGAAALLFAAGLPGTASAASPSKPAVSQSANTDVSSAARRRVVVRRVVRHRVYPRPYYYGYPAYSYGYAPYYGPRYYAPAPVFPFFPFFPFGW